MRYKTAVIDKLISVENGLKTLKFHYERGELREARERQERIEEVIQEIHSLINTNSNQE